MIELTRHVAESIERTEGGGGVTWDSGIVF